jgi:hypothetical protein
MTKEQFILKARQLISQELDYSNVKLQNSRSKVSIACKIHGEFKTTAATFLYKASGCPKCSRQTRDNLKRIQEYDFAERIKKNHSNCYSYDYAEYENQNSKLNVKCPLHGSFRIRAGNFLNGRGCPKCGAKSASQKRRLTTKEWISRAQKVHGNKYDYSKSVYKGAHKHIKIICHRHGEFYQNAGNHVTLRRGCKACVGISKITQNKNKLLSQTEFISRCERAHQNSSLDFSKSKYTGAKNAVIVDCLKHGIFEILAGNLMRGSGCKKCAQEETSQKHRTSIGDFITRASNEYGDFFDYSLVDFKNLTERIVVICPQHGAWEVIAANHLYGKSGCPMCQSQKFAERAAEANRISTEEFIERSIKIHGNRYDYSRCDYTHINNEIVLICEKHGSFKQKAGHHLSGKGCAKCANEAKSVYQATDKNIMLRKFRELHGNRYKYNLGKKIRHMDQIEITCPDHGVFFQRVNTHLQQKGCPKCSLSKGENAISLWLSKNGYDHQVQYPIQNKEQSSTLRFDFFIPAENLLIEYDGHQHYFPVNFGGMSDDKAERVHEMIVKRDAYKNEWAKKNNKRLLRIGYFDDINEVLTQFLSPISKH